MVTIYTENRQKDNMAHLRRAGMFSRQDVLAEIDADGEILRSGVYFCFQTLVVVHHEFNTRNVPAITDNTKQRKLTKWNRSEYVIGI